MSETQTKTDPSYPAIGDWMKGLSVGEQIEKVAPAETPPPAATPASPAPAPEAPKADAPAPAPAPTPAPEPESDDKWPRTSEEWKKFRENKAAILSEKKTIEAEKKALEDKLSKLDGEIKVLKSKPSTAPEELEKLKAQVTEYEKQLAASNLERLDKFRDYYDKPIHAAIERAKSAVGPAHAEKIARLMDMPDEYAEFRDPALQEIIENLTDVQKMRLYPAMDKIAELRADRKAQLENPQETWTIAQKAMREQQEQSTRQAEESAKRFVSDAVAQARSDEALKPFLTDGDSDTITRLMLSTNTDDAAQRIRLAAQGIAYVPLLKASIEDKKRIAELEAKVAAMSSSTPRPGTAADTQSAEGIAMKAGVRPGDVIKNWTSGVKIAMSQ